MIGALINFSAFFIFFESDPDLRNCIFIVKIVLNTLAKVVFDIAWQERIFVMIAETDEQK